MKLRFLALSLGALVALQAAEYRSIPLANLDFQPPDESLELALKHPVTGWSGVLPDVRADTEAYFQVEFREDRQEVPQGEGRVVFVAPQGGEWSGVIDLQPGENEARVRTFTFRVDLNKTEACDEEAFLAARRRHAAGLARGNAPGSAWFKHLAGEPDEEQGWRGSSRGLDGSFEVFSGGRAISENLALDRDLILARSADGGEERVAVADIPGVTVEAIDWSERLPAGEVAIDPLARFIPDDQHAVFSPSLTTLLGLLDRLEDEPVPALGSFTARNPYQNLVGRYRRQMGLDLPDLTTRLLPVKSVALTGGDPFFPTGTDVAILFETDKPERLYDLLSKAIRLRVGFDGGENAGNDGSRRISFVRPDRSVSSHVLQIGGLVAVTNSMAQVERLTAVAAGASESLGGTDEFRFFRHRYPLAEPGDALVFLSDATIRRWAGPHMRIGVSRRNRALAVLNELTSRGISGIEGGERYAGLLGEVTTDGGMARSERFGSAAFLTPVSELEIEEVTVPEKEAYVRWRTGYERGWSQVFDPIALRISLDDDTYEADLTVLPLTVGSDYREIMAFAGDAKLSEPARLRPATSLMHMAVAVDSSGPAFEDFNKELSPILPGLKIKPLSWVGDSISIDFHQSLFWESLGRDDSMGFDFIGRIPVSLRVASNSSLKLGLFLTSLRGMAESSAPDAMKWETHKHGERSYVVVSAQEADMAENLRICYATMPKALLIALDERILRDAMDRELAAIADPAAVTVGRSLSLDASPAFLAESPESLFDGDMEAGRQARAWEALPILNEWHRRFSDRDPVDFHEARYGVRITCPGGKGFRWNEAARTFESVAYGHPGGPRREGEPIDFINRFERFQTGLDFEDGGLRARLRMGPDEREETAAVEHPGGRKLAEVEDLVPLKIGRVLHYQGKNAEGEHRWSWSVKEVEETENGIRYLTDEPWSDPEDSGHYLGNSLLGDGERLLSWKDGESSGSLPRAELQLPAQLREGAVHRTSSRWSSRFVDEEETYDDEGMSEIEIRVLGLEDVEVPAGRFAGCVVVERRVEKLGKEWFSVDSHKHWYHPGTGLVKSEDSSGITPTMELVRIEEVGAAD